MHFQSAAALGVPATSGRRATTSIRRPHNVHAIITETDIRATSSGTHALTVCMVALYANHPGGTLEAMRYAPCLYLNCVPQTDQSSTDTVLLP
ncbi:hypothetical protein CSPAE12_00357 [Colletotrichum incanum]|nr:hypothetical protein CSPAE12_00357 [Colletotrichum incanum]